LLTDYQYETLNYQNIYSDLFLAANYQASVEARAASLCSLATSNLITTTVVCDCLSGSFLLSRVSNFSASGGCFSDALVPTSVIRPCVGTGTFPNISLLIIDQTATTTSTYVHFYPDSLKEGCVVASLAEVSAELVKDSSISLSSAFAKFKKPVSYAVSNEKDATVGNLLGKDIAVNPLQ
jgi:hypothetical protein